MRGRFITFEGGEGVGKSTQLERAADVAARARACEVVVTREPGGTPRAEQLRQVLLERATTNRCRTSCELLLMFAARATHLANLDRTRRRARRLGALRPLHRRDLRLPGRRPRRAGRRHRRARADRASAAAAGPHAAARCAGRARHGARARRATAPTGPDRFETERTEFFERVRQCYLERAAREPARFRVDRRQR